MNNAFAARVYGIALWSAKGGVVRGVCGGFCGWLWLFYGSYGPRLHGEGERQGVK